MASYDAMPQWYDIEDFEDEEEVEDAGKRFDASVNTLEQSQVSHMDDLMKFGSMYQNMDMRSPTAFGDQMVLQICNVTQAIVDALVAKQVVNSSKATFDVDDGDWEAHVRAEQLDRFVFGEFYRLKVYELHEQGFRDAAWAGDGWIKYTCRDGKVHAERVFPLEMRLDPTSCVSGPPRELYQVRYLSKSLAASLYPKHAAQILSLPNCEAPYPYPGCATNERQVRLQEGWHLPESTNDKRTSGAPEPAMDEDGESVSEKVYTSRRGAYMFACNGIVIESHEWRHGRFPFVRMPYSRDIAGGYSLGVVQQLSPLQREVNKLKRRKLKGLSLYGVPRVYQQAGATLTPDFSNDVGQKYVWTGAKPEVDMSPCVSNELVAEEQNLINQMYQLAGISPLERGSDMPSRFDSRPGMREYVANSDEKHALPSATWNRSFLEAAQLIIDRARDITEDGGTYVTFGAAKDFVSRIDFAKINMEDERFRIKLQNTNLLPTTPTGKRLAILDLLKANAFPNPMDMWAMMAGEHPDVDAILDRKTSGRKLVEKQMYMIVTQGKYFPPDVHQDCQYAKSVALDTCQMVLLRSNGGMDAETGKQVKDVNRIIAMLDKYMAACDDIVTSQDLANPQGGMNAGSGLSPDTGITPGAGGVPGAAPAPLLPGPAGPGAGPGAVQ